MPVPAGLLQGGLTGRSRRCAGAPKVPAQRPRPGLVGCQQTDVWLKSDWPLLPRVGVGACPAGRSRVGACPADRSRVGACPADRSRVGAGHVDLPAGMPARCHICCRL